MLRARLPARDEGNEGQDSRMRGWLSQGVGKDCISTNSSVFIISRDGGLSSSLGGGL